MTRALATAALVGAAVGLLVVAALAASLKWTVVGVLGAALVLPALLVRPARLWGLGLYLLLLELEPRGKSLDKYFVDAAAYLDRFGLPPSAEATIQILPSDVVLAVLFLGWLVRRMRGAAPGIGFPPAGLLLLAFLAWATLGVLLKADVLYFSLVELSFQVKLLLLFIYAANVVDSRRVLGVVVTILVACTAVQALVTLPAFALQVKGHPLSLLVEAGAGSYAEEFRNRTFIAEDAAAFEGMRALGTFGNPVHTALYLELTLPVAFAFLWLGRRRWERWVCAGIFGLGSLALAVTFSRAGVSGFLFGLAVSAVLLYRRGDIPRTRAVVLGYAAALALTVGSPWIYDFATSRPEMVSKRIPLMEKAALMIVHDPVLGVGLSNHTAAKKAMFQPEDPSEEKLPTHNHYLALASEVGLVGIALHLAFLGVVLREALRHTASRDPLVRGYAIAVVAALADLYLHLVADNLSGNATRSMFFFHAGAVFALRRIGPASGAGAPSESVA